MARRTNERQRDMKYKHYISEAAIVLGTVIILAWFMIPRFLAAQNINTPRNFPDPVFRTAVEKLMGVEPGGRFTTKEAEERSKSHSILDWKNSKITSIKGIEFLPYMQYLSFEDNRIEEIDLSKNLELRHLSLANNRLKKIDLSANSKIINLSLSGNQLSEIQLDTLSELGTLSCSNNQLTELDLSHCPKITTLSCNSNRIKELALDSQTELHFLYCSNNELEELNLSKNLLLGSVDCSHNRLKSLLLPLYIQTEREFEFLILKCSYNILTELTLDAYPYLGELSAENNRFQSVPQLLHLPRLGYVNLQGNLLSEDDCEEIGRLRERLGEVLYTDEGPTKKGFEFEPQANGVNILCGTE